MKRLSLKRNLLIYQKLVGISHDLASTLDSNLLLRRIVQVAAELCEAEAASILLFDHKTQELVFQSSTDIQNEERIHGIIVPKESIAGWVALHRQSVSVKDVHQDQRFFSKVETQLEFPTSSLIAVPMIVKDKLVGVLEALNRRTGLFTDEDLEYLDILGSQAAVAIENARLFHQSDLISDLVHEVRTPLTSINTICYLLEKPGIREEDRIPLVKIIHSETQRLNELATDFLDLARLESGRSDTRISHFSMALLVKDCCQTFAARAAENGIDLHQDLPGSFLELDADRDQVKQLVLNLVSNAIKYNRPNGKVYLRGWEEDEKVWLEVKDTGPGIPAYAIPRLFERFYRVPDVSPEKTGTGLGLSICKRIVENHGGSISVVSSVGVGTSFIFNLPKKIS